MAEKVLITTHDLEPAVELRDAFEREGFAVELLTASERIADVEGAALLILTGGLDQKRARRLIREAYEMDRLPVIGLAEPNEVIGPDTRLRLGLNDILSKPVDATEATLIGRRLI